MPSSYSAPTQGEERAVVEVRRRRLHVAQREEALLRAGRAGPLIPTSTAHSLAGVTCPTAVSPVVEASASHSSRLAVRRLVAASSATDAVRVDVRVAGPRRVSETTSRHSALHHLVVGPVRGARGSAGRSSPSGRGRRRCPRGPSRSPGAPPGRRCPTGTSAGAARTRPAGSGASPSGRRTRRASRAGSRARGAAPRPAAPGRCPAPCARGRTAYVARIHISSRVYEVAKPTSPSSSSATQQPPGSVLRKCRVRTIQACPRSGERSSGVGPGPAARSGCRARGTPRR